MAETLITLTIIGVIAAMTIPTLVSKYQKHPYVTGLKKAYSTVSNVISLAIHDEEQLIDNLDHYDDSVKNWPIIINKYMKVVKTCNSNNWEDCVELNENGGPILSTESQVFVTADGMAWGYHGPFITTDINGKKGPNQWGRDIFEFEIAAYNQNGVAQGTVMPYGSKLYAKYQGYDPDYWNNNPSSPLCTTEIVNRDGKNIWGGEAAKCTGRVLEEGAMNY